MSEPRASRLASGDRRIPQVGEVLCGVYRLDRVLGWGAVGIVYAAWHLTLGRACAVKLLHPTFVEHTDVRERFRREALSAFKLNHPHIIKIIDFREDESGWPMMVMELLHGESLRQRLGRGALPLSVLPRLFAQLCDAMAAAHQHGIVHRDLKPENIFLARLAQPGGAETEVLKVLDFGISKVTDHPEITATHALLGSPSYMSPEQARGDARTVDARADIFSLGALLFECLTGRKCFLAADPEVKRQLILRGAVPPLRDVAPELPEGLDGVLRRACAVDPAARFQTAQELCAALVAVLEEPQADPTRRMSAPLLPPAPGPAGPGAPAAVPPLPGMTISLPCRPGAVPAAAGSGGSGAAAEATVATPPVAGPPPAAPPALPPTVVDAPPTSFTAAAPAPSRAPPAGPAERTVPPAGSVLSQALAGLGRRLRSQRARQILHRGREALRGREVLVLIPLVFLVVLLLVIALDMRQEPQLQPLEPSRPRLQVIDGEGGSQRGR